MLYGEKRQNLKLFIILCVKWFTTALNKEDIDELDTK